MVVDAGQGMRMTTTTPTDAARGTDDRRRVVLASTSPRRRALLESHGYEIAPAVVVADDGGLMPGAVGPESWVMALAYLKASSAREHEDGERGVVLGADTVCVKDGALIGQPRDERDAERILRLLSGGAHEVLTGVALLCASSERRVLFCDRSVVRMGELSDEQIRSYVASGLGRGKAGGYNLAERLEAGWPIEYDGDMTSIMGLPMAALGERLEAFCAE